MSESLVRVVAAVIVRGEEMLVCRRPYHKRHGGRWEFPGGKCRSGESLAAATRRELHEELGVQALDVGTPDFIIRDEGSFYLLVFIPVTINGEPRCREHIELRWATQQELAKMPLAPSDGFYLDFLVRRSLG